MVPRLSWKAVCGNNYATRPKWWGYCRRWSCWHLQLPRWRGGLYLPLGLKRGQRFLNTGSSDALGPNSLWIVYYSLELDRLSHSFSWLHSLPKMDLILFNHTPNDELLGCLCCLCHYNMPHWTYCTNVEFLLDRFLGVEECKRVLLITFQVNIVSYTGMPPFLCFSLHCFTDAVFFYKVKARPSTGKKMTFCFMAVLALLLWLEPKLQ